ncbi:MAG: hypothetical protein ACYC8T_05530 [Myxococcaceae bacterium]
MAVLSLGLFAGCVTVVPMQTASVVPKGGYRVGGSNTITGYCSVSLDPGKQCNAIPLGVPTPELRFGARHGIAQGLDLGASLQGEATLGRIESPLDNPRGYQLGLFVDAKKELWSRPLGEGRRQLVSAALGLGYTSLQITSGSNSNNSLVGVVDLALPVYFGHETRSMELVVGVKYVERFLFSYRRSDDRREMLADGDLGLSFGFFGRGRTRLGVEFGYQTGVARPWGGLFNISAGVTWDLGLPEVVEPKALPEPAAGTPPAPAPAPATAPAPAPAPAAPEAASPTTISL